MLPGYLVTGGYEVYKDRPISIQGEGGPTTGAPTCPYWESGKSGDINGAPYERIKWLPEGRRSLPIDQGSEGKADFILFRE